MYDSDILFSSNNKVLLRRYRKLPAINCLQQSAEKVNVTEQDILKTNLNGMGNDVGKITNRVTSMMEVQARFPKDSPEYKELEYRITCGQQFQQDSLDKIKGIIAKPMPAYWYNMKACGDDKFLQSICADKKPYFMVYVYASKKKELADYIKTQNLKCISLFRMTVDELMELENKTQQQEDFLFWYNRMMPIGYADCAMNKICKYVEKQFEGHVSKVKHDADFNYETLKVKRRCTEKHRQELLELCELYGKCVDNYRKNASENNPDPESNNMSRNHLAQKFKKEAEEICPNDDERLNIILDMCYGSSCNRMFCWDVIGHLIIARLEELKNETDN